MIILTFLKELLRKWWASLGSAVFTVVGLYGLYAGKSNPWLFTTSLWIALGFFLAASFLVWAEPYRKLKAYESDLPILDVRPLWLTWLPEKRTNTNQLAIEVYIFARLSNVGRAETTIPEYELWTYSGSKDDPYLAAFKPDIGYKAIQLRNLVSNDHPLKRGGHVEGWLLYDLHPELNPTVDEGKDLLLDYELVVRDSFGQKHSSGRRQTKVPYDQNLGPRPRVTVLRA